MPVAVDVEHISKTFRLYHERAYSLKERIVNRRAPRYEIFWALRDVSLQIGTGETAGLIGPNGSGKSTLLKLTAGIIRPTEGRITTHGRMASLLELGAGFHPDLTGRENVFLNASILGISRKETEKQFDSIVQFAELENFIDMQVRHYSSGMYVRLGFAVAVHVEPEILIVDEVLAVGDEAFQKKCLDRIRLFQSEGRTIVFVTHAVDLVREVCNKAYFIWKGNLQAEGVPAEVIRTYRQHIHADDHSEMNALNESGTRDVSMTEVKIMGGEGVERQTFSPGEPFTIEITLAADEPVDDVVTGMIITDERDAEIFATNNLMEGVPLGGVDGRKKVRFDFPAMPLLNGNYKLSISVHDSNDSVVYHWKEQGWGIKVVNTGDQRGSVHFDPKIEVERA